MAGCKPGWSKSVFINSWISLGVFELLDDIIFVIMPLPLLGVVCRVPRRRHRMGRERMNGKSRGKQQD
eukprot:2284036-Amphidinium_carterae.1